jgi:hypothetical protein
MAIYLFNSVDYPRPSARPISTALGYNQLLSTNSLELLAEKGDAFLSALREKSDAAASRGMMSMANS